MNDDSVTIVLAECNLERGCGSTRAQFDYLQEVLSVKRLRLRQEFPNSGITISCYLPATIPRSFESTFLAANVSRGDGISIHFQSSTCRAFATQPAGTHGASRSPSKSHLTGGGCPAKLCRIKDVIMHYRGNFRLLNL